MGVEVEKIEEKIRGMGLKTIYISASGEGVGFICVKSGTEEKQCFDFDKDETTGGLVEKIEKWRKQGRIAELG